MIQTTATLTGGSSGGPLFNREGEVVGITTLEFTGGADLNVAVAIDQLKPAIEKRTGYGTKVSKSKKSKLKTKTRTKTKTKAKKTYSKSGHSVKLNNQEKKNQEPQVAIKSQDIFNNYCSSCHSLDSHNTNELMNLGDNKWILSSDYNDIVNIISHGKSHKGKIGYKTILSPDQIRMVANYIIYTGESN